MRIHSTVKAGAMTANHNQTSARGLAVKSQLRAGLAPPPPTLIGGGS
jgi:hypothetical protein